MWRAIDMAIKDDLEKISKVPERQPNGMITPPNPTAFAFGLAAALVKMMLSITFDPLKGINIPGAEDFLRQTTGIIGLNAAPVIKSLNTTFDEENLPVLNALVNVSGVMTKYVFEVSEDSKFEKPLTFLGSLTDDGDKTISETVIGKLNSGQKYFYRLKLENKNGSAISDIFIFLTKPARTNGGPNV